MSMEKIQGHIAKALQDGELTLHEVQTIVSKEDPFYRAPVSVGSNVDRDEYRTIADFATMVAREKTTGRLKVGIGAEDGLQDWLRANKDEQTSPPGFGKGLAYGWAGGVTGSLVAGAFGGLPGAAAGFFVGGIIGAVKGGLDG